MRHLFEERERVTALYVARMALGERRAMEHDAKAVTETAIRKAVGRRELAILGWSLFIAVVVVMLVLAPVVVVHA